MKPTHELWCAAVPGGCDFRVVLYSHLHTFHALGLDEDKSLANAQKKTSNSVFGQKLKSIIQIVTTKQEGLKAIKTRLIDAEGITLLVETLLSDWKDCHAKTGFIQPDALPLARLAGVAADAVSGGALTPCAALSGIVPPDAASLCRDLAKDQIVAMACQLLQVVADQGLTGDELRAVIDGEKSLRADTKALFFSALLVKPLALHLTVKQQLLIKKQVQALLENDLV